MKQLLLVITFLLSALPAQAFDMWGGGSLYGGGDAPFAAMGAQTLSERFDGTLPLGYEFTRNGTSDGNDAWNPDTGRVCTSNLVSYSTYGWSIAFDVILIDANVQHFVSFVGTGSVTINGIGTFNGAGASTRTTQTFNPAYGYYTGTFTGDVRELVIAKGTYQDYVQTTYKVPFNTPKYVTTTRGKGILIERATTPLVVPTNTSANLSPSGMTGLVETGVYYGDFQQLRLTENTSNGEHSAYSIKGKAASALTYTWSAYFAPGTRTNVALRVSDAGANYVQAVFNTSTGAIVSNATANGNYVAVGQSARWEMGLWRFSITFTTNTGTLITPYIMGHNGSTTSYVGNGSTINYVAAQLEQLPYATSPMLSGSSARKRANETLSLPTQGRVSNTAGSVGVWVYVRPEVQSYAGAAYLFGMKNGSDLIELYHNATANQWTAKTASASGTSSHVVTSALSEGWHLIGMQWDASELALVLDGVKQASPIATPYLPASVAKMYYLGSDGAGTAGTQANMVIDEVQFYNRPLISSELLKQYVYGAGRYPTNTGSYFVAWGDSLTAGAVGTQVDYPFVVSVALNRASVNRGLSGRNSAYIRQYFMADPIGRDKVNIFWIGHNNTSTMADAEQTIADLTAMVNALGHNRFLILTLSNGSNGTGTNIYNIVMYANSMIATNWPNNYYDIRGFMKTQGTMTGQDLIDYNNDAIPSSLRVDGTHYTNAAYALMAVPVANFISAKGW